MEHLVSTSGSVVDEQGIDRLLPDPLPAMVTTETPVDRQTVEEIVADWPEKPFEIAETIMDKYGSPDEAAPSELLWYDTSP